MTVFLFKRRVKKVGFEDYFDLYAVWEREGKIYHVLIKPCFNNGYRALIARAVEVPDGEPFEKYM